MTRNVALAVAMLLAGCVQPRWPDAHLMRDVVIVVVVILAGASGQAKQQSRARPFTLPFCAGYDVFAAIADALLIVAIFVAFVFLPGCTSSTPSASTGVVVLRAHPPTWANLALTNPCPGAIEVQALDWPRAPIPAVVPGPLYSAAVIERVPGGVACVQAAIDASEAALPGSFEVR